MVLPEVGQIGRAVSVERLDLSDDFGSAEERNWTKRLIGRHDHGNGGKRSEKMSQANGDSDRPEGWGRRESKWSNASRATGEIRVLMGNGGRAFGEFGERPNGG